MSKNDVFEIEVLGWEKNQKSLKKNHSHFMVSKRIFDDHKVATLTPLERLLYVTLLARCADECSSTITPTRQQLLTSMGCVTHDLVRSIASLQENQLVRVLKSTPNTIQKKTREKKTIQDKAIHAVSENAEIQKSKPAPPVATSAPVVKQFISRYCELWKSRHGSNPDITGKDSGIAKRLVASLSAARSEELLQAFFKIPDAFIIKAKHPLTLFELKLKEIGAFADSGNFVSQNQAVKADAYVETRSQLERIRSGEL